MNRIIYVFPGQGSQSIGMAREIYSGFPEARRTFDHASHMLDADIVEMCLCDPEKGHFDRMFSDPMNAHPALFVTSSAYFNVLRKNCDKECYAALGNSFGQYTALYAVDAIDFDDNMGLVKKRAEYMKECAEGTNMAAIIGRKAIDQNDMSDILNLSGTEIALINSDRQLVLAGSKENVLKACKIAKMQGYKTLPIKIQGSSHASHMKPASKKLRAYLESVNIRDSRKPIIANSSASYISEPDEIRVELEKHLYMPVLFRDCIKKSIDDGADTFIEIGPGNTFSEMIKRDYPQITTFNMKDKYSIENTLRSLQKSQA